MLLSVVTSCLLPAIARAGAGRAGLAAAGRRCSRAGPHWPAWPV